MIEPIQSLSFAMHSNQEGYAILLGSGISKAAGIPTGWEVVLDLLAKLARLENLSLQHSELADWYRQETGKDPSYSGILEGMAKTPSERQKMLQSYWEATDEEREAGIKQPTPPPIEPLQIWSSGTLSK